MMSRLFLLVVLALVALQAQVRACIQAYMRTHVCMCVYM